MRFLCQVVILPVVFIIQHEVAFSILGITAIPSIHVTWLISIPLFALVQMVHQSDASYKQEYLYNDETQG